MVSSGGKEPIGGIRALGGRNTFGEGKGERGEWGRAGRSTSLDCEPLHTCSHLKDFWGISSCLYRGSIEFILLGLIDKGRNKKFTFVSFGERGHILSETNIFSLFSLSID